MLPILPTPVPEPKPRWQGETRDLPNAIRNLAVSHQVVSDIEVYEAENWVEFVDDLVRLIAELQRKMELVNKETSGQSATSVVPDNGYIPTGL